MNLIGNIVWIIFGGFFVFLEYLIGGLILCLTIIGIPFGVQCFNLAVVALAHFGMEFQSSDRPAGCLSTLLNIIWILCGGIWIALTHLFFGILLCITIIGIPFGMQHFKLMGLAFTPFGQKYSRK